METFSKSITDINVVSYGNCKRELFLFSGKFVDSLKMKHVCFI